MHGRAPTASPERHPRRFGSAWRLCAAAWPALAAVSCLRLPAPDQTSPGPSQSRNWIAVAELEAIPSGSAYDAIKRLRPRMLSARGNLRTGPLVVIDGARTRGLESLRALPIRNVLEIRYLTASEGTTRFGERAHAGVITVRTVGH